MASAMLLRPAYHSHNYKVITLSSTHLPPLYTQTAKLYNLFLPSPRLNFMYKGINDGWLSIRRLANKCQAFLTLTRQHKNQASAWFLCYGHPALPDAALRRLVAPQVHQALSDFAERADAGPIVSVGANVA